MNTIKSILTAGIILLTVSCKNDSQEAFAYGNFESEDLMLSSQSNGILLSLKTEEGDRVEKGDLIAIIDSTQLDLKRLQLVSGKKTLSAKISQINSQEEVYRRNLENLERELKRFGNLFLEKAATKKQVDDLEGQITVIQAQLNTLEVQKQAVYTELETLNVQIKQMDDQIDKCRVKAPISGTVLEKYSREGELTMQGKRIVKIADLSNLYLRAFIDGNQLSLVSLGDKVNVVYDGAEDLESIEGTVTWISSEAEFTPKIIQTRDDRVSLVYAMKVIVPNNGSLKIGMPGEINLK